MSGDNPSPYTPPPLPPGKVPPSSGGPINPPAGPDGGLRPPPGLQGPSPWRTPPALKINKVDTDYLRQFASNLETLVGYIDKVAAELPGINILPGAFYEAQALITQINGLNGGGGLAKQLYTVLQDGSTMLAEVRDALLTLADKYKTTEELNGLSSATLAEDLREAQDELTALLNAGGGSGGSGGGSGS